MAIIYSYPTVIPTTDDLVLGTDSAGTGKPTKNFSISSIIDLVTAGASGLGAVIKLNNSAKDTVTPFNNQSAIDFLNLSGTGILTFPTINSTNIVNTVAITTASLTATGAVTGATLNGVLAAGSSIAGLAGGTDGQNVLGVTQNVGDNSTRLATTAYVMAKVDTSVLQYLGDATGPFNLDLVSDDLKIAGTTNQIETTATTVAGNVGTITLGFPTAGVILPDGSAATTQALGNDTTLVATTAFVQQENDAQDLDFSGTAGTGSVILGGGSAQVFAVNGTANQIATTASGQTLAIALTSSVQISGTYTGTTFAGDLNGTINTATTGVTQAAGDDSTLIATTAYVDAAAGAKTLDYAGDATGPFALNLATDDLEFNGDSNITVTAAAVAATKGIVTIDLNNSVDISGTMTAGTFTTTAGTASWSTTVMAGFTSITSTLFIGALQGNADSATALASAGQIQLSGDTTSALAYTYTSGGNITIATSIADTVVTGKILTGLSTATAQTITATDTILEAFGYLQSTITGLPSGLDYIGTWDPGLSATAGGTPDLRTAGLQVAGHYYICSADGIGTPNGNGTTPDEWKIGDWVMRADATINEWQKIDNTSTINGTGVANKIARWTGTQTLGTGLIDDDGSTVTIGNTGALIVEGNTTLGNAASDTVLVKGPATFEAAPIIELGIGLGAVPAYGGAGQVLTSGGAAATVNSWSTPTTGTVTSVGLTETGSALTITGSPITSSGTLNIAGAGTAAQYINGALDLVTFPTVDNYQYWIISDNSTTSNITTLDTAVFAAGNGITTSLSGDTLTTAIDVSGTDNAIAVLNTAVPVATDTLWFNDISGPNTIRKATIADIVDLGNETLSEVLTNGNTTGGTNIAVSAADDITFTDTSKALFGTGNDLQIYNDGSDGFILNGTGSLVIGQTSGAIALRPVTGENGILIVENAAVTLYYDNSAKLATTSTGVSVTGSTTTSNVLIVNGANTRNLSTNGSGYLTVSNAANSAAVAVWTDGSLTLGSTSGTGLYDLYANNGTFANNVQIDGNLTVDGQIIHGGSSGTGGGTFTGTKAITAVSSIAFTLKRAVTGTLVFDVYMQLENSTNGSVAKKYTVAHSHNTTPVYNKLIDTGPDASNDFSVVFSNATGDVAGDSVTCNVTSTTGADLSYTVMVGYDHTRILTFTAG